jgi:hypothetical protein
VEDEIQLTHVLKRPVKRLDKHLNQVKDTKLGFSSINDKAESSALYITKADSHKVQRRIMTIDDSQIVIAIGLAFAFAGIGVGRREDEIRSVEKVANSAGTVLDQ